MKWLGIVFVLVLSFQLAHSEDLGPYVWAPPEIIMGEDYEGLVVLDQTSGSGQMVILSSSDPTVIQIPQSVSIHPYTNHGIFPIKPLRQGPVEIFAAIEGKIVSASLSVYSSSRQPEGLKIVLPTNTTKAQTMLGYVTSVDAKGSPAPVLKDTTVRLSSTPTIELQSEELKIKQGNYSARFVAEIKGTGKIYASSQYLAATQQDVFKIQDNITVRIAVAPNIMMENSKAYFFIWLEKDSRPYKPPHVIHAYVSSSNLKSVRFTEMSQVMAEPILGVPIVDGVGTGYLVSQERGTSVITASVEGIGSAQANVVVGPVLLDENFKFVEPDDNDKLANIQSKIPNVAFAWFYPEVTDSKAYGVVALYNTNVTQKTITTITDNNTQIQISSKINRVVPVPLDDRVITLSSDAGLDHPAIITLTRSNSAIGVGSPHAIRFEVIGQDAGNHTLSVSGPGLELFRSSLRVEPAFYDSYRLKISPIPAIAGGDVAMISISDQSGALVDAQKTFAGPVRVAISLDGKQSSLGVSSLNSVIYSGILDEPKLIMASADGFAPVEQKIIPAGIASSVRLDVPQKVHIAEPFPFSVHEVDSFGIPIRKLSSADISATNTDTDGNHLRIDGIGTQSIAALSRVGADSMGIDSFANTFSFSISSNGTTNRIGKNFELRLDSDVDGLDIHVDSPIPYKKMDQTTYLITPDREGQHTITFTAQKDGFAPATESFSVYAEKFVDLAISAIANDGEELNIGQTIQLGNMTKSIVTPYKSETRPEFLDLSFPTDFVVGSKGYKLSHVTYGYQNSTDEKIRNLFLGKDTDIVATYSRMVKIDAHDAAGSGFYPYGQTVVLSVPPKDRLLFLVRDTFDHWEGLPYSSEPVSFAATQDVTARAVLKTDYTILSLAVACTVSLLLYYQFVKKKGINITYYLKSAISRLEEIRLPRKPTKNNLE